MGAHERFFRPSLGDEWSESFHDGYCSYGTLRTRRGQKWIEIPAIAIGRPAEGKLIEADVWEAGKYSYSGGSWHGFNGKPAEPFFVTSSELRGE